VGKKNTREQGRGGGGLLLTRSPHGKKSQNPMGKKKNQRRKGSTIPRAKKNFGVLKQKNLTEPKYQYGMTLQNSERSSNTRLGWLEIKHRGGGRTSGRNTTIELMELPKSSGPGRLKTTHFLNLGKTPFHGGGGGAGSKSLIAILEYPKLRRERRLEKRGYKKKKKKKKDPGHSLWTVQKGG